MDSPACEVRFGSKTEAAARHGDVRFTPETGLGSRVYEYTPYMATRRERLKMTICFLPREARCAPEADHVRVLTRALIETGHGGTVVTRCPLAKCLLIVDA